MARLRDEYERLWDIVRFAGPTTQDYEDLRAATHAMLFCVDYVPDDAERDQLKKAFSEAVSLGGFCFAYAFDQDKRPCLDNCVHIRRVRNRAGFETWAKICQNCNEDYLLKSARIAKRRAR